MARSIAILAAFILGLPAVAAAQAVPTPLQGPAAFDPGMQVRVLASVSAPSEQVALGFTYGGPWLRVAAGLGLDAAGGQAVPAEVRMPEMSKARYEPPEGVGNASFHVGLFLGVAPTLLEFELDDERRLGFEALAGVGADLFFDFSDDQFPLRFAPELGLGIRAQLFDFLFARVVVSAERDLTELVTDLADATFVLRGAIEVGATLPEPQPALDEAPDETEVRASFALERPLEDSTSRPGAYFVTVGIAY